MLIRLTRVISVYFVKTAQKQKAHLIVVHNFENKFQERQC